jgi:DNA mismatch endonuclease (patch repair protein)
MGMRYRKNVYSLPGKPDIVFYGSRVAVFCDGDFWHGRHWSELESKLLKGWNGRYWVAKIAGNRERDKRNTAELESNGWHVIRIWESDIRHDPSGIAIKVYDAVTRRKAVFKLQCSASGGRP